MTDIWFTSDHHFGHEKMIAHAKRPYSCADEMDEDLIKRHNELVKPNDIVYHLGDVSLSREKTIEVFKRLNGKIYLIRGNHDHKNIQNYVENFLGDRHYLKVNKQLIVLDHYAPRVWRNSQGGSWALYGHSHGNIADWGKSVDVGVDNWQYEPVNLESIKALMDLRPMHIVDHHKPLKVAED